MCFFNKYEITFGIYVMEVPKKQDSLAQAVKNSQSESSFPNQLEKFVSAQQIKTSFLKPIRLVFHEPIRKIRASSANENNVSRANRIRDNKSQEAWLKACKKNQSKLSFSNQPEDIDSKKCKAGFPRAYQSSSVGWLKEDSSAVIGSLCPNEPTKARGSKLTKGEQTILGYYIIAS